jgi:Fur family ferric uptake transcriptional regulator
MGSATVYRHLERLVGEGLMLKYSMGSNGAACFEYVGPEGQCCTPHCFHCVCTSCGRLIHVECAHLAEISGHMLESHGFAIDPMRTVFYGVCEDCASQE